MIVIDASIVVKVLLDEPDSEEAVAFLRRMQGEVCGPDVLTLEVCRAWVAAVNARRIDSVRARGAIGHWLRTVDGGAFPIYSTGVALMGKAVDLAIALGHPLSDCIYLALADQLGCTLVTADLKFRDRVDDPARVRLLTEFA